MRNHTHVTHARPARIAAILGLLALLLGGLGPAASARGPGQDGPAPTAAGRQIFLPLINTGDAVLQPESDNGLGFSLALSPAPQIAPGGVLRATITGHNSATTAQSFVPVTLRYPILVFGTQRVEGENLLMVGQNGGSTLVMFRSIGPGETVSGTVLFKLRDDVVNGTALPIALEYPCGGTTCSGGEAQVQVSDGRVGLAGADASGDLLVAPASGGLETVFRFSSNRFNGEDLVRLWLYNYDARTSSRLPQEYRVGSDGWVRFELKGSAVGPGNWSVLATGTISSATAAADFSVTATAAVTMPPASSVTTAAPLSAPAARPAAAQPAQSPATGGIAGTVTNAAGAGVADVLVVASQDGAPVASARTRAGGVYLIPSGLATGAYEVRALAASAGGALSYQDAAAVAVSVTAPELTAGVNFSLARGGTLAGRVSASDTRLGLGGVAVEVRAGATVLGSGVTGASGSYQIEGLPEGTFTVSFTTATGDDGNVTSYADTSVAGVSVAAGATVFVDEALALRSDIASLRGRVSGTSGGLGEVLVVVLDATGDLADLTLTRADGSYATGALEDGVYRLAFLTFLADEATTRRHISAFYGGATLAEATEVTISGPRAVRTGLDATLALGGTVSGTVRGAENAGLEDVLVAAYDAGGQVGALARTSATGAYELAGLPAGSYKVGFFAEYARSAAVRRYQDGYYLNKPSLATADAVTVAQGQTTGGIDATLAQGGAITGVVTAEGGAALEGVVVIAFDGAGAIAAVTFSDASGAYTTPGLAPGGYSLLFDTILAPVAATRAYLDEYFNDRQAAPFDPVTVSVGASIQVDAALARGGQIAGRVIAADTKLGLSGVAVLVYSGNTLVDFSITDAGGNYTTPGLPTGSYTVRFDPSLTANMDTQRYAALSLPNPVAVTVGSVTPGADAALTRP